MKTKRAHSTTGIQWHHSTLSGSVDSGVAGPAKGVLRKFTHRVRVRKYHKVHHCHCLRRLTGDPEPSAHGLAPSSPFIPAPSGAQGTTTPSDAAATTSSRKVSRTPAISSTNPRAPPPLLLPPPSLSAHSSIDATPVGGGNPAADQAFPCPWPSSAPLLPSRCPPRPPPPPPLTLVKRASSARVAAAAASPNPANDAASR